MRIPYLALATFCSLAACSTNVGAPSGGKAAQSLTANDPSATYGTNTVDFTLQSSNDASQPLAFDWGCSPTAQACNFAFNLTPDASSAQPVTDWANSGALPVSFAGETWRFSSAVVDMVASDGNGLQGAATGRFVCNAATGVTWSCSGEADGYGGKVGSAATSTIQISYSTGVIATNNTDPASQPDLSSFPSTLSMSLEFQWDS